MKSEDYVSYELASKLIIKGFDWFDKYQPPQLIFIPLYQAQKWLREEKGIDIDVTVYRIIDYDENNIERSYEFEIAYKDDEYYSDEYFKTYELALAEALNQALELI